MKVVVERPALPAPVALEVYAVLTRLPPPHRAVGSRVRDFLGRAFPAKLLTLSTTGYSSLVDDLVELGVGGGASYDAVIALIAREHDLALMTLDPRPRSTYDRIGTSVRLLVP